MASSITDNAQQDDERPHGVELISLEQGSKPFRYFNSWLLREDFNSLHGSLAE